MLSTINKILNDNNLTMTCCEVSYYKDTERGSFNMSAYCEFSGKVVRKLVPIFYQFWADSGLEVKDISITEDYSHSAIDVWTDVTEPTAIIKHFAELYRNVHRIEIYFSIKDKNLHLEAIKGTGNYNKNVVCAYPNSVMLYNTDKEETIYTYDGWRGFMATEFEDVAGKAGYQDYLKWLQFCHENTYRFTVSCPSGDYHYIARPLVVGSNRANTSAERYAKAYEGWKNGVNRYQKGLISFYRRILKDFICLAKEEYPEIFVDARWTLCNDSGTKLMPEHYENFVITKMEKQENEDEYYVSIINKVH